MKKAFLFISILFTLTIIMISCSSDDDEGRSGFTFITQEPKTAYIGGTIDLELDVNAAKLYDLYLYIGEKPIPASNISIERSYVDYCAIKVRIPNLWMHFANEIVTYRNSDNKILATGPMVSSIKTYRFFGSVARGGMINAKLSSVEGTNKVVTLTEREPFAKKKHFIEFKGYTASGTLDIELSWQDLAFPLINGRAPSSLVGELSPSGFSTRDNITYMGMYYSSAGTSYVVQEYGGVLRVSGEGMHTQLGHLNIADIEQDRNNIMFIRTLQTPNCIYKMSELNAPVIWVGSATESRTIDGDLLNARFEDVVSIDRDSDDNLYVAQKTVVRKITPHGEVTTLDKFRFEDISAIAIGPDNRIYVIDREQPSVLNVIDTQQSNLYSFPIRDGFSDNTIDNLYNSCNIAVSNDGIVYIGSYTMGYDHIYHILVPDDWNQ